ncbi:hypothetical protein CCACVL1_25683, partial [Corchorus capsularis]
MNCEEAAPLVEKFDDEMLRDRPNLSNEELEKVRDQNFPSWLR